ncbi:MAG: hypothetical protein HYV36_03220, partial [Lentisphaerae bacterium]|nr:hypothetical protein [Lentisphaerota bacterium]
VANSEGACQIKVGGKTIAGGGAFVVELVGPEAKAVYRAANAEVSIQ